MTWETACYLMQRGSSYPVETKALCTKLATKLWTIGFYCLSFSRVHYGDVLMAVLERSLTQWFPCCTNLLQVKLCKPANDPACAVFGTCKEKVFVCNNRWSLDVRRSRICRCAFFNWSYSILHLFSCPQWTGFLFVGGRRARGRRWWWRWWWYRWPWWTRYRPAAGGWVGGGWEQWECWWGWRKWLFALRRWGTCQPPGRGWWGWRWRLWCWWGSWADSWR